MRSAGVDLVVEGGGSHTLLVLFEKGELIQQVSCGSTNPLSVGWKRSMHELAQLVNEGIDIAGERVRLYVAHGYAATRDLARELGQSLMDTVMKDSVASLDVVNDLIPLLFLPTGANSAIVACAGTGTGFIGRSDSGEYARASGLEFALADEGGAFDIGQSALRAAIRSIDGRGPATLIKELVTARMRTRPDELLDVLYDEVYRSDRSMKLMIADQADIAFTAASEGDAIAMQIIDRCADELAAGVISVGNRLRLDIRNTALIVTGSLLTENPSLQSAVQRKIGMRFQQIVVSRTGRVDALAHWVSALKTQDASTTQLKGAPEFRLESSSDAVKGAGKCTRLR